MKKHIIIAGVPRSGKSTLCQKISNNFGYQHISMDSIIAGIEKTFPETEINSDADRDLWENIQYISSKMSLFIRAMIESGEYDECDYGMVIDIFQLLPKDYTYYKSEEERREDCEDIVMISKKFKQLCRTYDLPYFDTSYNREQIFREILLRTKSGK